MNRWMDATLEHHRMGGLRGRILEADGTTVLTDIFAAFGVTQVAEYAFNFAGRHGRSDGDLEPDRPLDPGRAPGRVGGNRLARPCALLVDLHGRLRHQPEGEGLVCPLHRHDVGRHRRGLLARFACPPAAVRLGRHRLGRVPRRRRRHRVVRARPTRRSSSRSAFPACSSTTSPRPTFSETVNTLGLPRYAKAAFDPEFNRWVKVHTQMNPLPLCLRPRVLQIARRGA